MTIYSLPLWMKFHLLDIKNSFFFVNILEVMLADYNTEEVGTRVAEMMRHLRETN
jgi:hypothetical protein